MKTNEDGTKEQVYPITSINAIDGLEEALDKKQIKIGVMSVNGQSGDIDIPIIDEEEHADLVEMLNTYHKGEISDITMEKVGEV